MDKETANQLKQLIDQLTMDGVKIVNSPSEVAVRILPEGKRVVRTKTSGDKVYRLDEKEKLRQWVVTGDVLTDLGYEQSDVEMVEDLDLIKYRVGSPIHKV